MRVVLEKFENAIEGKKKFLHRYFSGILPCFKFVVSHLLLLFQSPRTPIFNNPSQWFCFCKKGNKMLGGSLGNLGIGVSIRTQKKLSKLPLMKRLYIFLLNMFFQQFPTYRLEACNFVSKKMAMIACTKFAELILEDLWGGFFFYKIKTWNYTEKTFPRSRFSCKRIRVFRASWEWCSLHNLN